jgi:hypothetical protein
MDRAARLLARAWYRAWRPWWIASAASLSFVLVLVLGTAGLLEGMEATTEERVADFYTGDLRITAERAGAAPPVAFGFNSTAQLDAAIAGLAAAGGEGTLVVPRVETTYLVSRRTLLEAYLFEDEQYGVSLPGVASDEDAYSVGVLAGLPVGDAAVRDLIRPYLVTGAFPRDDPADHNATVDLLMSVRQFQSMLTEPERQALHGEPSAGQLAAMRLEITAARVDSSGPLKDVIRFPARVTGLYRSGIDALDSITVIAPIGDARRLLGSEPGSSMVNAFSLHGADEQQAEAAAEDEGWESEGPTEFTQRYLGQLVDVVRVLGVSLSSLLLVFPFFMVWVGMSQQLDRSRRELGVCRAIGMQRRSVRKALSGLVGRVAVLAVVPTLVVLVVATLVLPSVLATNTSMPFPLGFAIPAWALVVSLANLVLATAIALRGAVRRYLREDLASTLRTS